MGVKGTTSLDWDPATACAMVVFARAGVAGMGMGRARNAGARSLSGRAPFRWLWSPMPPSRVKKSFISAEQSGTPAGCLIRSREILCPSSSNSDLHAAHAAPSASRPTSCLDHVALGSGAKPESREDLQGGARSASKHASAAECEG